MVGNFDTANLERVFYGFDPVLLFFSGVTAFVVFRLFMVLSRRQSPQEPEVTEQANSLQLASRRFFSGAKAIRTALLYLVGLMIIFCLLSYRFASYDPTAFLAPPQSTADLMVFVLEQSCKGGLADFFETFDVTITTVEHNPSSVFAIFVFAYRMIVGASVFGLAFRGISTMLDGIALLQFFVFFELPNKLRRTTG